MNKHLQLGFKGSRQYLQGPDIYNGTLQAILAEPGEAVHDINFSFHRLTGDVLLLSDRLIESETKPVAVCSYARGANRRKIYVIETGVPVSERRDYDERAFAADIVVDVDAATATWTASTDLSDIETWVALTKALHQRVYASLGGKWILVRCKFNEYVESIGCGRRELRIASNLQNRLTRTVLSLDGHAVGEIHFSLL